MFGKFTRSSKWAFTAFAAGILSLAAVTVQAQSKVPAKSSPVTPNPGASTTDPQLYRNKTFAFRYRIPYGWVDRTKEMQEGNEAGKGEVLLAAFERPPEATGYTVNSAVVIASESTASYPGLQRPEDYLGPLTEVAAARGFKPEGESSILQIDSRQLLRADFVKPLVIKPTGSDKAGVNENANENANENKNETNNEDEVTMRQCTLVLLAKGQIVSFTFIAGSVDELNELVESLHFDPQKSKPR